MDPSSPREPEGILTAAEVAVLRAAYTREERALAEAKAQRAILDERIARLGVSVNHLRSLLGVQGEPERTGPRRGRFTRRAPYANLPLAMAIEALLGEAPCWSSRELAERLFDPATSVERRKAEGSLATTLHLGVVKGRWRRLAHGLYAAPGSE